MPEEHEYIDSPEVDYQRFLAGIVDAIEASDRWNDFVIENVPGQAPGKGSKYRNAVVALASVMLCGVPNPSWKEVQEIVKEADPGSIPRRALQHRSELYQERLEGLRAEARELLQNYGEQFLGEAFRGGTAGVRAVSVVAKEKEREMKARSRGPAKAGATAVGSSSGLAKAGAAAVGSSRPAP